MTRPAHTPWVAAEVRHGYDQVIRDSQNNAICSMLLVGWDKKSAAEHVALIVRAVNCHDELVKALRLMLGLHDGNVQQGRLRFEKGSPVDRIAKVARAALARAKEQP